VRQEQARHPGSGVGVLARRTSGKLLKEACAAFNDRFRIEEQKSALATAIRS
jgi:hypothetical protein